MNIGPSNLDFTVGWICTSHTNSAAARNMLDRKYKNQFGYGLDGNIYSLGQIGPHNVVIACPPMGSNPAAIVATRMMSKFPNIKIGLLVGIGGGLSQEGSDIRLGDVVVSKPDGQCGGVVQYDLGKWTTNGLERIGSLNAPPERLLAVLNHMPFHGAQLTNRPSEFYPSEPDLLYKPGYDHVGGRTCKLCDEKQQVKRDPNNRQDGPHIFYGTIASGNSVIKNTNIRDKLIKHGVLCFEMEAAGLMNSSVPYLAIRGISDYADSHRNGVWLGYAAATAAQFARDFLIEVPESLVHNLNPIKEFENAPGNVDRTSDPQKLREERNPLRNQIEVANVRAVDKDGKTALHYAAQAGKDLTIEKLVDAGADVKAVDKDGKTALHYAAQTEESLTIWKLIDAGADIEAVDKDGKTALHYAAQTGESSIIWHLIDTGADVKAVDKDGKTALHYAAQTGESSIIWNLIDAGADVEAVDKDGKTALHYAAQTGKNSIIWHLMDARADVKAVDKDGKTALHYAAQAGKDLIIDELVDAGANGKAVDKNGKTALHYAAQAGLDSKIQICLQVSADLNLLPRETRTVFFEVYLDLEAYIAEELDSGQVLGSLLTLTGTATNTYATSCENYLKTFWPETGTLVLDSLADAYVGSVYSPHHLIRTSPLGSEVICEILQQQPSGHHFVRVSVYGSAEFIIQVAQQLVWLASTFRIPQQGVLSESEASIKFRGEDSFDIRLLDLRPIQKSQHGCWHAIFVNSVIARGFPIPDRPGGEIGIELPFELMTSLAHVRYSTIFDGGIVLKGFTSMLFPTSAVSLHDSIQWHFESAAEGERMPISIVKNFPWVKITDLESAAKARTFLGYFRNSCIHLGTADSGYKEINFSGAEKEGNRLVFSGFGVTVGIPKIGPTASVSFTLNRSIMKTVKTEDFDTVLRIAVNLPFILYDCIDRRGWLVPATNILLHMAMAWVHCQPDLENSEIHPAELSEDGGQAALNALRRNAPLTLSATEEKQVRFQKLIERLWEAIDRIFNAKAELDLKPLPNHTLRGWELMGIVLELPNPRPKEAKIKSLWSKLSSDENIIVLFCRNLGQAIRPNPPECVKTVPKDEDHLAASVPSLNQLLNRNGGKENSQLTDGLYWSQPRSWSSDTWETIQKLTTDKPSKDKRTEICDLGFPDQGCIVFGNNPGKLRKPPPVI